MYRKTLYNVLMICVLTFICMNVYPQSRLDSLQHLSEVVITAKTYQKEVIPVQQLSGTQLQNLSSHNVADALRYFSGIQIKDYGGVGGLKTVNIRSMGTNHVGVFYDGIELGNAQNGQIDLGRFSLDNMEAVTLYNGQKSAIFQPAKDFGSAGSIYLQSRTPKFNDDEKYHIKATFKTGSFGLANPSFLWEQKVNDKINTSLSAEYMYTTGKYKFTYATKNGYDTTAIRQNGDVNAIRVEGGIYGKVKNGYWRTKAYFYNSERGYPGAIVRNKFTHEDRQWDTNAFVQGAFKKDVSSFYSLMFNAKYAYDYLHYLADPNKDESLMYTNNHYYQHEAYASIANRFTILPFWDASLSADYQMNLLDADLQDFVYPRRHTALVAVATALHFDKVKMQASLLGTFVHDNVVRDTVSAANKMEWTPTAIISYKPFQRIDLNFRAFYKRIFRMPTLNDLYYTFIGNINLKPEYTNQYNVGFTYSKNFSDIWFKYFEIQADAYYNEVENKIIATPTSNFFRWTMINLGKVKIKGVDAALQTGWQIRKFNLDARVNYTYQKAQDFTDPTDEFYGGQIPYIPWHSGSLALNAMYRSWYFNYSFIYTGERYSSQANIAVNYQQPWYTSDLSIAKEQKLGPGNLKITLEVNNIFNQQYEVVSCYPMPGINFKCILQYSF